MKDLNTVDIQLACASGQHDYWYPQNEGARCRWCGKPEIAPMTGALLPVAEAPPQDDLLDELEAELKRIATINTAEDRPRVVPELTVFIWLQKARAASCVPRTPAEPEGSK